MQDTPLSDTDILADIAAQKNWEERKRALDYACARRKSKNQRPAKVLAAWKAMHGYAVSTIRSSRA